MCIVSIAVPLKRVSFVAINMSTTTERQECGHNGVVGGCKGGRAAAVGGRRGRSRGMERTFNSKHVSRIRTLFVAVALDFCFAILSLAFLSMHKCTGRNTLGVSPSHALLLTQLGCFKPLAGLK